VYADGNIFNTPKGEKKEAKREIDAPVPFADVRLVVPYRALVPYKVTTTDAYGYTKEVTKTREVVQDVVVDKLVMERHTTGVDPFTNVDYGKDEFPEEHRFYPETGLPIFKRYIAGTQEHIQWPWEFNEEEYKNSVKRNETLLENPAKDADAPPEKPKGRLGRSIDWVKDKTTATKAALSSQAQADLAAEKARARDEREAAAFKNALEKASKQSYPAKEDPQLPSDGAEDTSRNLAEVSAQSRSFYPTLMYPPFPNELADELAADIRVKARADAKDKSDVETMEERKRERARKYEEAEEAKAREEAIRQQVMLTPMQLRWELERERKLREEKPLVQKDVLLAALGMHMSAKGVRLTEKRMRAAESANVD
jgi:large subunit ribosomal protein L24